MVDELLFFMEVLVGGLLAGTMYSLVALGFVLIFKASATFNFSQGAMVCEKFVHLWKIPDQKKILSIPPAAFKIHIKKKRRRSPISSSGFLDLKLIF